MLQLHFKKIPWLKQSEKSEGSKTQKIPLLSNFLGHDEILREFSKMIEEQLCGFVGEPSIQEDANFISSSI